MPKLLMDVRSKDNAHRLRGIGRYVDRLLPIDVPGAQVVLLQDRRVWTVPRVITSSRSVTAYWFPRPRVRFDPIPVAAIKRKVRDARADLVHLTDPYALQMAPDDVPLLCHIYDLIGWQGDGMQARRFTRGLEGVLARSAPTDFAVISEAGVDGLGALGVARDHVHVIPPGPTALPATTRSSEPEGALVVGALDVHKQPQLAQEAARLAGMSVTFAGRFDPAEAIERGFQAHELRPHPSDAQLALLFAGATCLVHASSAEGFGLPVLEALVRGLPVVAFDLDVTREIVGPSYPLVPVDSGAAGLAEQMRAFTDATQAEAALNAAHPYTSAFDWPNSQRLMGDVYRLLLGLPQQN